MNRTKKLTGSRSAPVEWTARHNGAVHATVNAATGAAAVAMVGDLAHISPVWAAAGAAAGGIGTLLADTVQGASGLARLYRTACWAGAGGWVTHALATSPWSLDNLGALLAGSLGLGVLAPALARHERREVEREHRAMLITQRRATSHEWASRLARICQVRGTVVGVENWDTGTGYTVDVELHNGATWKTVKTYEENLASDARLPEGCGVEVNPGTHRGACLIRVSTVNALVEEKTYPSDYGPLTINNPFPIGVHLDGSLTMAELRWICALLIGQVGSGKTNMLQVINAALTRCVDTLVWHIDLAGGGISLPWLHPYFEGRAPRPAVDWAAATPGEALAMVEVAGEIIGRRKGLYQARMRAANDDKLPVGPDVPEIIVVADEFAELPFRVREGLESISNTGRAAGVRVLNCALRGTADIVPVNVKKQAGMRIGMRVTDQEELIYLFGNKASVDDAPYEGCGHIKVGQTPARPFRAWRLKPDRIDEVAVAVADRRPALDGPSADGPLAARYYRTRWDRMRTQFAHAEITVTSTSGNTGDTGQATTPTPTLPTPTESIQETRSRLDQAREDLRRAVADHEGRDPKLAEKFEEIVSGQDWADVDWSDPTTWKPVPTSDLPTGDDIDPAGGDAGPASGQPIRDTAAADWRARALELLAEAGEAGTGPKALAVALRAEGYSTVRQTVSDWLAEQVKAGVVDRLRTGVYILRRALPPADGE